MSREEAGKRKVIYIYIYVRESREEARLWVPKKDSQKRKENKN